MKFLAVFLLAASVLAADDLDLKKNIDSFEYVWKTVKDKHWDPQLGGVDWQAVHNELRPRIEKAENIGDARKIMTDMLGRLHLSHFRIIPGLVYSGLGADSNTLGGEGTIGIDVRVINGQAVVTSVDANSPAAKAFVAPGWVVKKIGSEELGSLISEFSAQNRESTLRDLTLRRAILLRLEGTPGETVRVEFRDGRNEPVVKEIPREEPRGESSSVGYLGPARVWLDSRQIKSGQDTVEYIGFNLFLNPQSLMPQFESAVKSCLKCQGMVIDLRGNPGGLGAMATGMAGWFVDRQKTILGTLYLRETALKFVINPRPETYAGPLAILVDSCSASTAEIFAGGLQDLKRARVFGTRTAAAALPSVIERLPNGDAFQYAIANYVSEGGKELEGNGVTPDEVTPWTREALLAGKDPALDAALRWIHTQAKHE